MMLPFVYATKKQTGNADYDANVARRRTEHFSERLPGGRAFYQRELERFVSSLYSAGRTDARFVIDKTTRYYLIIDELAEIFPQARFIFLRRHPLAVLSSAWHRWCLDDWSRLQAMRRDLLAAPDLIMGGAERLGERAFTARYEALLASPLEGLNSVYDWLGLDRLSELPSYRQVVEGGRVTGDPKLFEFDKLESDRAASWAEGARPQLLRLMRDYLLFIGPDRLKRWGYDYGAAMEQLRCAESGGWAQWGTIGLMRLLFPGRFRSVKALHRKLAQSLFRARNKSQS